MFFCPDAGQPSKSCRYSSSHFFVSMPRFGTPGKNMRHRAAVEPRTTSESDIVRRVQPGIWLFLVFEIRPLTRLRFFIFPLLSDPAKACMILNCCWGLWKVRNAWENQELMKWFQNGLPTWWRNMSTVSDFVEGERCIQVLLICFGDEMDV